LFRPVQAYWRLFWLIPAYFFQRKWRQGVVFIELDLTPPLKIDKNGKTCPPVPQSIPENYHRTV